MKVKAYEWENSVEVELKEIRNVVKGFLLTGANNWNDATVPNSGLNIVQVNVYYPKKHYHYEVCIINKRTEEVAERHCFSSSNECRPEVVARELVKMYQ